jgi:hypothetical protein
VWRTRGDFWQTLGSMRQRASPGIGLALSALMLGCASTPSDHLSSTAGRTPTVEVEGRLLEYEAKRFWCDYDRGASMHSEGTAPWGRFQLTRPAVHAGRTFEVWFKCGYSPALVPASGRRAAELFVLALPEDFLVGSYSSIEDCDVGPAVAARWRLIGDG